MRAGKLATAFFNIFRTMCPTEMTPQSSDDVPHLTSNRLVYGGSHIFVLISFTVPHCICSGLVHCDGSGPGCITLPCVGFHGCRIPWYKFSADLFALVFSAIYTAVFRDTKFVADVLPLVFSANYLMLCHEPLIKSFFPRILAYLDFVEKMSHVKNDT